MNRSLLSALQCLAMMTSACLADEPGEFAAPSSEFRAVINVHGRQLSNPNLPDWLAERHAGGAVLDAGTTKGNGPEPYTDPRYLDSPVAFQQLRDMMTRLKRKDIKVWIYDELGYPSGSAGGRVLTGHPEFAAQAVRCRSLRSNGQPVDIQINKQVLELVSCRAFPNSGGVLNIKASIDLTAQARAGALTWKPPDGAWTVCVFERIVPDTWKRHNIPRRNVNIMDRKTVARFIELTHQRYAKELGPQLDDVVLFFTDEPQLGALEPWMKMAKTQTMPAVQWCDELPIAFQRKKGYPITDALPALFHNVGPATARYRHDFYDVYSDLTSATSNVTLT